MRGGWRELKLVRENLALMILALEFDLLDARSCAELSAEMGTALAREERCQGER